MSTTDNSPPAVAAAPVATTVSERIVPWWHTLLLLLVLVAFSAASAGSQREFVERHGRVPLYLLTIAWEWVLTGYVLWGLRRARLQVSEVVGGKWKSPEDALLDLGIAAAFWLISAVVLGALGYAFGFHETGKIEAARKQVSFLFPQSGIELVLWAAVSATAGFCEELIFRGYLQRQLGWMLGASWLGVIGQAAVFGASHAYEGWQRMIIIGVWGAMFGALVLLRRSLRPGMIAHGFHDLFVGVVGRTLLK